MFQLWAWGANNYGQLANGAPCEQLEIPAEVADLDLNENSEIICGGGHTFLLSSRRLYAAGWNHKGQLGLGHTQNQPQFGLIAGLGEIVQVAAGWDFSLAIDANGQVWGCGSNTFGQLGLGAAKAVNKFKLIVGFGDMKVKKVAAGMRHSLFLLEDGSLMTCGSEKKGQLCQVDVKATPQQQPLPVPLKGPISDIKAGQAFSILVYKDGSVEAFGDDKHGQVSGLKGLSATDIHQIEVGWTHVTVLSKTGQLKSWGRADYGQTGSDLPSAAALSLRSISSGYEHVMGVDASDGSLYSWGWNEHGNCGLGHTQNVLVPTKVACCDINNKVWKCFAGSGHSFAILMKTNDV
jgi:secretion-regulating guanine nucleotide exchange factor